jgi:hypothetical protein
MRKTGLATILAAVFAVNACAKEEAQSAVAGDAAPASVSAASSGTAVVASADMPEVTVYKDPNCGCCANWVDHMKASGFKVKTVDTSDVQSVKQKYNIGSELQSCHTAIIGDYAIEGHVPADVIVKFLNEKPQVAGLAVPGMPAGSPGMEGATKERYDVLTFDRAGRTTVYAQR